MNAEYNHIHATEFLSVIAWLVERIGQGVALGVQKTKVGMLLMEAGASYNKQRLHNAGCFRELLATNPDIDEGLGSLLRLCRETVVRLQRTESVLVRSLERDALLLDRVFNAGRLLADDPGGGS